MARMSGKVALITGAARGQGREHAIRLAEEGAEIVATDICSQVAEVPYPMSTPEDLQETVALVEKLDRRCLGIEADAGDTARMREVVAQTVEEFGRLDSVVINHGIGVPHTVDQDDADAIFDATIEANLSSVWRTARAAIPQLRAQGGGSITITSSAAGLVAFYGFPGYVASKHGVIGLGKALAAELASDWIRVNVVCPTNVATPMLHNQFIQSMFTGGDPNATVADMEFPATATNLLPIPWIEPRAISEAVLWLSSDEAKYVTGIALPVDAGMTIQPPGITPFLGQRLAELGNN